MQFFSSKTKNQTFGERGEHSARDFLLEKGWRHVLTNFKVSLGRTRQGAKLTGEIDLVMFDNETLVFVEVKTRSKDDFTTPETAVDRRKQRQLVRIGKFYRQAFNLSDVKFRYDVVSVILHTKKAPKITHFKAFFNEESQMSKNNL